MRLIPAPSYPRRIHLRLIPVYRSLAILAFLLMAFPGFSASEWVRAGVNTNQPIWGLREGLLWAIPPAGFRPPEPRGLIRLGAPILPGGGHDLVNFIAIEPIVRGHRGYSELERSQADRRSGKRIHARPSEGGAATNLVPGSMRQLPGGHEELEVVLDVEKFENGAHVRLVIRQRSDRPDEIELGVFKQPDSAALDECILTATMGNMARTRRLWLKDEVVNSLELYRDYKGTAFAPTKEFPLARLHRTVSGSVLVAVTNDEEAPATVFPFPRSRLWHYGGRPVTQYWAKPAGTFRDDLRAAVNARYTYWLSDKPIPGGIAFENFELRERFYDGQIFVFGITDRTPEALGFVK